MRRLLVSVLLLGAFGLFLLMPEERRGRWLKDGSETELTEFHDPGLEGDGVELEPAGPRQTLSGHVRLPSGAGVAGVTVRLEHAWVPEVRATTDSKGRFELTPQEPRGELAVDDVDWFLLGGELVLSPSRTDGYVLAVAPPLMVQGRVIDAVGQPIKGADVTGVTPSTIMVPLGVASLPIQAEGQSVLTNRAGHFSLGPVPDVEGLVIEVKADGFHTALVSLPGEGVEEFLIPLVAREEDPGENG